MKLEVQFLETYFKNNCYPFNMFNKIAKEFLENIFKPKSAVCTVPKKIMYVSLPFTNNSALIKRKLLSLLSHLYPYVDFRFTFNNPLTIGRLFRVKDTLPELMRTCIVNKFNCPKYNFGTYVGCTKRLLKVRIDSHRGVSHRTGLALSKKENSAIRLHAISCHHHIQYSDFQILGQTKNSHSFPFLRVPPY